VAAVVEVCSVIVVEGTKVVDVSTVTSEVGSAASSFELHAPTSARANKQDDKTNR